MILSNITDHSRTH